MTERLWKFLGVAILGTLALFLGIAAYGPPRGTHAPSVATDDLAPTTPEGEYLRLATLHRKNGDYAEATRMLEKEMARIPMSRLYSHEDLLFADCLDEQAAIHRTSGELTGVEDNLEASARASRKRRQARLTGQP